MPTIPHNCPDCDTEGNGPTGQVGMYRDGSPIVCWTCDGTGMISPALAAELALVRYREASGFTIWENDGDTWIDNSTVAVGLREAYYQTRVNPYLPDLGERTPNA